MDSFFPRFKNVLVLITLLLAQVIGLAIQVRRPVEPGSPDGRSVTLARAWMVAVVAPVERFFLNTGHAFRFAWSSYLDLRGVREQNFELHQQIGQMRLQQVALAEDAMQGHRLQALLAFQQHYVGTTVAAQVIGTSGTDMSRVLYIDKGSADGLKADMPVITPDGIVGKIRDVFPSASPHTAQVLLINDQTSGAGVVLATTRVRAIIHGSSAGAVQITNLTKDDRIKPGEQVLTSGGDLIFPRGLPVGTIESVAPDPEHQPYTLIHVRPTANLFQLEEVLVVTGTAPSLPPATLKSLAKGAALTAEARAAAEKAAAQSKAAAAAEAATRSAADIVGDRLPSLHEGGATDDPKAQAAADAKNPKNAGGTVPKPLPTMHQDRFSPGTSAPANSLTPGAPRSTATPGEFAAPAVPHRTPRPPTVSPGTPAGAPGAGTPMPSRMPAPMPSRVSPSTPKPEATPRPAAKPPVSPDM